MVIQVTSGAVGNTNSILGGQTAGRLRLQRRFGVNLIAISRSGERLTRKLGATVLRAGDVIVLQGPLNLLPERLRDLGALPLAERALRQIGRASCRERVCPSVLFLVGARTFKKKQHEIKKVSISL